MEVWDVYDQNRNLTGRTHRRGEPMRPGDYHLIVFVWIFTSRGEFFITRRAPEKVKPLFWETTGGSALAGENSLTAALREAKEETGLTLLPENGRLAQTFIWEDYIGDVWLFKQDATLEDFIPQEGETIDAMLASKDDIRRMLAAGEFLPASHLEELFALC